MRKLASIVFLYYTALWALVSTLVVYVTRYLSFSSVQLGALMSAYGLATLVREHVYMSVLYYMYVIDVLLCHAKYLEL